MRASFSGLVALLGLCLPLLASAKPIEATLVSRQTTPTTNCASGIHLMVAGGCAQPCTTGDSYGLLYNLIVNITNAIPGTDNYLVPYDNSTTPAMHAGVTMIQQTQAYVQQCPQTPIVYIGYSFGGIVIMNVLCGGIDTSLMSNVIFASVYGEETYIGNVPYDRGSCTNNAPKYPRNDTSSCLPWTPRLQSYCFNSDPNCCSGGTNPGAHFIYPGYYDDYILANVTNAYSSFRASQTSSSTSSISTSIPIAITSTTSTTTTTSSSSSSTSTSSSSTSTSTSSTSTSSSTSSTSTSTSTSSSTSTSTSSTTSSSTSSTTSSSTSSSSSTTSSTSTSSTTSSTSTSPTSTSTTSSTSTSSTSKSSTSKTYKVVTNTRTVTRLRTTFTTTITKTLSPATTSTSTSTSTTSKPTSTSTSTTITSKPTSTSTSTTAKATTTTCRFFFCF